MVCDLILVSYDKSYELCMRTICKKKEKNTEHCEFQCGPLETQVLTQPIVINLPAMLIGIYW